jgi:sec-independent protein translocase protein TatA
MFGLGVTELVVILIIVLVVFGASRLPEIGSGLGKAIRGFKESVTGKDAIDVTPKKAGEEKENKSDTSKS